MHECRFSDRRKEKFPIAVTSELVQENMIRILKQCLVDDWLENPSEYAHL